MRRGNLFVAYELTTRGLQFPKGKSISPLSPSSMVAPEIAASAASGISAVMDPTAGYNLRNSHTCVVKKL